MPLEIEPLTYPTNALEPYIDQKTMEIHHGKHYATYVSNYNDAVKKAPSLEGKPLEQVLAGNLAIVPEEIKTVVRNNGGGAHNHALFWKTIGPNAGGRPVGNLAKAIDAEFGSFEAFKDKFETAAKTRFGSGWAWLVKNQGKLEVYSTANQDSPLMEGKKPLLGLDVWEHAYYLTYQNRRPEYVAAFWNIVKWDAVEALYNAS